MMKEAELQRQLDIFRIRFAVIALQEAERLRTLAQHDGDPIDEEARKIIEQVAHQMAGAGGTFGFPDISAQAAIIEDVASVADATQLRVRIAAISDLIEDQCGSVTGTHG